MKPHRLLPTLLISWLFLSANAAADFADGLAAYEAGDYETAFREWKPVAEQGYAGAQHNLGVMYDTGKGVFQDYREAAKWYTKAAEQGYVEAQHNLAVMYAEGRGVLEDREKAVKWYTEAAEQNLAESQYNLGMIYADGRDYREAFKWYAKAAEQGDTDAQRQIGTMYSHGRGVLQDIVYAHLWFNIASVDGNTNALYLRDMAAKRMTSDQLAEAQRLARECVKKEYKKC